MNQLSAGVSYFQQVFADADAGFDPIGLGLDTGSPVGGAPCLLMVPPRAAGRSRPAA